jgi:hypothetical protein
MSQRPLHDTSCQREARLLSQQKKNARLMESTSAISALGWCLIVNRAGTRISSLAWRSSQAKLRKKAAIGPLLLKIIEGLEIGVNFQKKQSSIIGPAADVVNNRVAEKFIQ